MECSSSRIALWCRKDRARPRCAPATTVERGYEGYVAKVPILSIARAAWMTRCIAQL